MKIFHIRTIIRPVGKHVVHVAFITFFLFTILLYNPSLLFSHSIQLENLTLYSDHPFSSEAGITVLEKVQARLSASPIYSPKDPYSIYICNTPWRRGFFFIGNEKAAGLAYYPMPSSVFLCGGDIQENQLINRSGAPDRLGRDLAHFITHEIGHHLTAQAVSWHRYLTMPNWIKEGYVEYLGSYHSIPYEQALRDYLRGDPLMSFPPSVPYRRYALFIAYLLEKKHWDIQQLLNTSLVEEEVEAMLRRDLLLE